MIDPIRRQRSRITSDQRARLFKGNLPSKSRGIAKLFNPHGEEHLFTVLDVSTLVLTEKMPRSGKMKAYEVTATATG